MKRTRKDAFAVAAPDGWGPAKGDVVFLPARTPFLRSAKAVVLWRDRHGLVGVRYRVNGYLKQAQVLTADLRRCPGRWEFL